MSALDPAKLHVRLQPDLASERLALRRGCTLTHSNPTGDLFRTVARDYNRQQVAGWYTRRMREEVLAEGIVTPAGPALDVHCHASGGLIFGSAFWRNCILLSHMRRVIQALRQGDGPMSTIQPELERSLVRVHFHSHRSRFERIGPRGRLADYRIGRAEGGSPREPAG